MKRFRLLLILIILYLIQTGCFLKSVHPLVDEESATLVEGLEGIWETDDQRWTFINNVSNFPNLSEYLGGDVEAVDAEDLEEEEIIAENAYMIFFENLQDTSPDTAIFIGAVTELNDAYFLDLFVFAKSISELDVIESNFVENHFFPVHTFSKIKVEEDLLSIEFFRTSFIEDLIRSNRIRIKHEKADGTILITASTNELQKFVEKYAHEEDAFEDPMEFTFKGFRYVQ